ncbi:MAG: RNA polymerase sigma factor, partial [Acidimicrobiia bacterium]
MGTDDGRSDAELVAAAVGGDRAAFGAIYERYVDRVHGFSFSFLRSSADAADATQDTFVRAAEQLAHLRDPSKLRPWLFAIARTTALARLRRRGRDAPDADVTTLADAGGGAGGGPASPVSAVEQAELATLVWDAAAALDDRDRLVLELTVRQGLDGAELADALGVTHSHAHVLAHRARQRVERSLGAFLVARLGRRDCAELARLLAGWDGRFSLVVRKKVARHVDGCRTCEGTRGRALSPVALLATVPVVPMAADRRRAALAAATSALEAGPSPRPPGSRDDGCPPAGPRHGRRRPS